MYGTSDTQTVAESMEFAGYTLREAVEQKNIAADGSTIVNIYYDRNEYTITFDTGIGSEVNSITARYGSGIAAPGKRQQKSTGQQSAPGPVRRKPTVKHPAPEPEWTPPPRRSSAVLRPGYSVPSEPAC